MGYEDPIRSILAANRPVPPPAFSARMRRTLHALPKVNRTATRFALPVSAVVFMAAAALCFAAVNGGALRRLYGGPTPPAQFPAAGGQTAAEGQETAMPGTPQPTMEGGAQATPIPTPGETAAPTPEAASPAETSMPASDGPFLQPVNAAAADNGVNVTVLAAGTDGTVLQMKIKAGPFAERTRPNQTLSIRINGVENTGTIIEIYGIQTDDVWGDGADEGYATYTVLMPLTAKIDGNTARVELTGGMDVPGDLFVEGEDGEKKTANTHVSVKLAFDINVCTPQKLDATGSGLVAYGIEAALESAYRLGDCTVFTMHLRDNAAGDIGAYFCAHEGKDGNTADRVLFTPEIPRKFGIVLCGGRIGTDYIKSFQSMEHVNVVIAAGEKLEHELYAGNTLLLERDGDSYRLILVNAWKGFEAKGDVTIFTKGYYGLRNDSSEGTNDPMDDQAFYVTIE